MLKKFYTDNENIHILGRTTQGENKQCHLFWTASGVEFIFQGTAVGAEFTADYAMYAPWISIFLDGVCLIRMPLNRGKQKIMFFENMAEDTVHRIRILKEVQAMHDDEEHALSIDGILLNGVLKQSPRYRYRLEFVGDSITSAEGAIGAQKEMDWISAFFCPKNSYPVMVADEMQADFRIVSQSGWGVYKSWDGYEECAIPRFYSKVCGLLLGEANKNKGALNSYDFKEWQPDAVIINLGTNDDNCCKDENERKKVTLAVENFLKEVRSDNPEAQLVWAYGMLGDSMESPIQMGIVQYQKESHDSRVHFLPLVNTTEKTKGARMHPGELSHRQAKETICALLQEILE